MKLSERIIITLFAGLLILLIIWRITFGIRTNAAANDISGIVVGMNIVEIENYFEARKAAKPQRIILKNTNGEKTLALKNSYYSDVQFFIYLDSNLRSYEMDFTYANK